MNKLKNNLLSHILDEPEPEPVKNYSNSLSEKQSPIKVK